MEDLFRTLTNDNPVIQGLLGGIIIALLNMLGAMLVLVWRKPSDKYLNVGLGFAAGVMLTASFTSLILPGIEYGGIWSVIIGIVLGVMALGLANTWMPYKHSDNDLDESPSARLGAVWLFIIVITLHNMPEGLAVGVAFGSGDLSNALTIMMAIGLQNIPEGFAVSVAALNAGLSTKFYASLTGVRAGLVEIPLAVLGAWAVQLSKPLLPYAMGFAAGAMLFVISEEIIPETHRLGKKRTATLGLMLGVVIMLYLDVALT